MHSECWRWPGWMEMRKISASWLQLCLSWAGLGWARLGWAGLGWAGHRSWSWSCKCLSLVIHHFQLLSFRFTMGQKVGSKILLDSLCMVASVIFEDAKIDINTAVWEQWSLNTTAQPWLPPWESAGVLLSVSAPGHRGHRLLLMNANRRYSSSCPALLCLIPDSQWITTSFLPTGNGILL